VTYPDNGDVRHLVDIVLTAEIDSSEVAVSSESMELRFFNPDSFPTELVPRLKSRFGTLLQGGDVGSTEGG